ncbi:rhomboid family intramembrane serine protease [Loktanella sp. D2R18]|uniref:rhomboid family intramembrane serine protease n=1 Tax=Rhodobacterales TaxID=204455 RepID=UPI000DEA8489|nr:MULTISPECIES: rhomboid family intramembrane serine protease [Rhodobacterales]MDO6588835.1 rhomboid family intramembrane serine protease [Yoonia sp. 1_MG-2023]RBW42361.1 rhomboid family intramembrane serine protease [Loktanella sp. D2R18]
MLLPFRDHNPSERVPYVTIALILLNILIFIGSYALQTDREINRIFAEYGLIPARLYAGNGLTTPISYMFLHSGFMHLAGNMLFLWIYGDNLEDKLGHVPFLIYYLLCGIAAGLAQYASEPLSLVPMVGASGAIAGVMGGYILLFPKARVDVFVFFIVFFRIFPLPAWITLGFWFGVQIFNGLNSAAGGSGVAHWAHAGGFVAGFVLMLPFWFKIGNTGFWKRTEGHPDHPETQYKRSNIPVVKR